MIPKDTVVEWERHGSRVSGVVVGSTAPGTTMVKMDEGEYNPQVWPDGLIVVANYKLRVVK